MRVAMQKTSVGRCRPIQNDGSLNAPLDRQFSDKTGNFQILAKSLFLSAVVSIWSKIFTEKMSILQNPLSSQPPNFECRLSEIGKIST